MFTPSRDQASQFFTDTWRKYRACELLHGLEQTTLEVVRLHSQLRFTLDRRECNLDRDWLPGSGQMSSFLHLSLHLAVQEQLSIGQPAGTFEGFDDPAGHTALRARCTARGGRMSGPDRLTGSAHR